MGQDIFDRGVALKRLPLWRFIKDNAETVDIGSPIQWLAFRLFPAEVAGTARAVLSSVSRIFLVQLLGDAEVRELPRSVLAKQDIHR